MPVKKTLYIKIMDKCLKLLFLTAAIELHSVNLVITEKISSKAINLYIFFLLAILFFRIN